MKINNLENKPILDVVIVNYNGGDTLLRCVSSVLSSTHLQARCIVIDNNSVDTSLQTLQIFTAEQVVIVKNDKNIGFSAAVNQGFDLANSEWVMLLNPDAEVDEKSLAELLAIAEQYPNAGAVGCLIKNSDGTEQRGCRRDLPKPIHTILHGLGLQKINPNYEFNHTGRALPESTVEVEAISGACMLIRKTAHQAINGFDDRYFLHFEDLDYCARLKKHDWKVYFTSAVSIYHEQGVSSKSAPLKVIYYKNLSMLRFFYTHGGSQRWLLILITPIVTLRTLVQLLKTLLVT